MISLTEWEKAVRGRIAHAVPGTTVTIGAMPDRPDKCVTVQAYEDRVDPDPDSDTRLIRLQVRSREAPGAAPANGLAEDALAAILGHGIIMGAGTPAARVIKESTARLGLDARRRDERTDNVLITTHK